MESSVNMEYSLWREPLVIPVYLAAASALLLVCQVAWRTKRVQRLVTRFGSFTQSHSKYDVQRPNDPIVIDDLHAGFWSEASQRIRQQGVLPFTLRIVQFSACVALVFITIIAFVSYEEESESGHGGTGLYLALKPGRRKLRKERKRQEAIHHAEWIEVALCAFYVRYEHLIAYDTACPPYPPFNRHICLYFPCCL